jgi:hypothetical protein
MMKRAWFSGRSTSTRSVLNSSGICWISSNNQPLQAAQRQLRILQAALVR